MLDFPRAYKPCQAPNVCIYARHRHTHNTMLPSQKHTSSLSWAIIQTLEFFAANGARAVCVGVVSDVVAVRPKKNRGPLVQMHA